MKVPSKGKVGLLNLRSLMLVVADKIDNIKGLTVQQTLVTVKGGPQNYIKVPLPNKNQHHIFVPNNQLLGHLQLIKSVTTILIKTK